MKIQIQELPSFVISLFILLSTGCGKSSSPTPTPTPPAPTITSFSPVSAAAGEQVIINGTNFSTTTSSNSVKFNGAVASVSSATTTQLTVIVPTGITNGKITVTIGGQTATSTADFILLGMVSTLAGNGSMGNVNGTGTAAQFGHAPDLALDAAGNIYVAGNTGNFPTTPNTHQRT